LVLAGIHSVTVGDTKTCDITDLSAHLFLDINSIGKNRAEASVERIRELNPHVVVSFTSVPVAQIDLSQFDLCCLSGLSLKTAVHVNHIARKTNTLFLVVDTFGIFGYMFEDLLDVFTFEAMVNGETEKKN